MYKKTKSALKVELEILLDAPGCVGVALSSIGVS